MIATDTTEVNSKWYHVITIDETTIEDCLGFILGKQMKKWIKQAL